MRRESVVMAKTKYTRRYDVRDEIRITPPVFPPRRRAGTARSASRRGVPTARRSEARAPCAPDSAPAEVVFVTQSTVVVESLHRLQHEPLRHGARPLRGRKSLCAVVSRAVDASEGSGRRQAIRRTSLWSPKRFGRHHGRAAPARDLHQRARGARGARCAAGRRVVSAPGRAVQPVKRSHVVHEQQRARQRRAQQRFFVTVSASVSVSAAARVAAAPRAAQFCPPRRGP